MLSKKTHIIIALCFALAGIAKAQTTAEVSSVEMSQNLAFAEDSILMDGLNVGFDLTMPEKVANIEITCLNRDIGYAKTFMASLGKQEGDYYIYVCDDRFKVINNHVSLLLEDKSTDNTQLAQVNLIKIALYDADGNLLDEKEQKLTY